MSQEAPKNILIVLLGAIGDVTRALPLAVRIKKTWPNAKLTWAIEPISYPVIQDHPSIDEVITFDRPKGFGAYLRFIKELRSKDFDLVLDLQRHLKSGFTSFYTGSNKRLGFNKKNAKEFNWIFNTQHIDAVENFSPKIHQYQKFGDKLGLVSVDKLDFGISPTKESLEKIKSKLDVVGPYAGLILGSTWPSRFWTVEAYVEVIQKLKAEKGLTSVLIGSAREEAFSKQILDKLDGTEVVNLVSKTALNELYALFSVCDLAIGSDSGPMHMAAAVGTPVISLWGSTSPKRSAPYGNESLVLQSAIACSPCYLRECPGLDRLCMRDIPAEAVMAQVERVGLK